MEEKLWRVGTTYIPVTDVEASAEWYADRLGADVGYKDGDKAIVNLADQSFFLVKSPEGQTANFKDVYGEERFSVTFEVDGLGALEEVHTHLLEKDVKVGHIEERGHAGKNFVFCDPDGNKFDVWSELSPKYKKGHSISG